MIYTTNFAKLKRINRTNSIIISIAAYNPKWLKEEDIDYWYNFLAPTKDLLFDYKGNKINWDEYEKRYIENFNNSWRAKQQVNRVLNLADEKDVYLLCYEKSTDNCHRHILGKIISECGYEVKELY